MLFILRVGFRDMKSLHFVWFANRKSRFQGAGYMDKHQYLCFNMKRKQHSMNTQDSLKVQSRCFNLLHFLHLVWQSASAIYWPLNRVSMETPGCLTNTHSWTIAEVISASHKAVNTFVCRSKEKMRTVYRKIGKEIEAEMKVALKKYRGSRNGTKDPINEALLPRYTLTYTSLNACVQQTCHTGI